MKWLDKEIIIDTISINIAALIFSILSLFCSIITILIYTRVKSLRTIIYKLFFLIAINETISRFAHIFQFINENFSINSLIIFEINIILIYLTDTSILIFLAYSCYSMFELILKQNKQINYQFSKIALFILIFSIIITVVFTIISFQEQGNRDIDLYSNVIALNFIKDTDINGQNPYPIVMTSILYFFLVVYSFYKVVLIQCFIKNRGNINDRDEDDNQKEEKIQKSLKLKSFKNKMLQYPVLGLYFIFPLLLYTYIEYFKVKNDLKDLAYLRIRYIIFNIYCFMNSTRGWMFFRVFISNEKIKIFLFKNYLTSKIFYTIDKIILKRERGFTKSSSGSFKSSSASLFNNDDTKINEVDGLEGDKNDEEVKLLELNENNDLGDENDENAKIKKEF